MMNVGRCSFVERKFFPYETGESKVRGLSRVECTVYIQVQCHPVPLYSSDIMNSVTHNKTD